LKFEIRNLKFWRGALVKGEKFREVNISRGDILINICYLVRSRAIGMRGKPHLKQEQTLVVGAQYFARKWQEGT